MGGWVSDSVIVSIGLVTIVPGEVTARKYMVKRDWWKLVAVQRYRLQLGLLRFFTVPIRIWRLWTDVLA